MTLPAEDPRSAEGSADATARPDWLRGTDEEVGGVRAPRAPAPLRPPEPSDEETERLEGLVGPEFPSEPPPSILGERDAQLGVDPLSIVSTAVSRFLDAIKPASGSSAAPQPPPARAAAPTQQSAESLPEAERKVPVVAWTAAASSVPALRGRRRNHAQVVPDAVEPWEDAEDEPAALRPPAPARSPAPSRPRSNPALLKLGEIAKGGVAAFSRWPRSMKIGAGAALLVAAIGIWLLMPKEHFTRVGAICANAQQLDGQVVHIHGTVGQVFPMGGGHAFYLRQGRDVIVVFTTLRVPVERQRIKLIGTVSTGFLDGKPRAAVFEVAGS